MALSEIHCIGKNWLLERYPHKHRKHDRHIFFCFLGFSVLFFKYFILLEDVSIFRVPDFSSRLSFKCAQICNFFFLYDTRRNRLSAPHTPPSCRTHSHSPIVVGDVVHGRIWMHFFAFWKFVGFRLFAGFFVCGARPWYLAKELHVQELHVCFCFPAWLGFHSLPQNFWRSVPRIPCFLWTSGNPSVIWCRFIFRLIAFAPGAAT